MRRILLLVPAVAFFALLGVGLFRARPDPRLGAPVPAFSLPSLADPARRIEPAGLRGRPAVVNFWASWCEPCREEAPAFAAAARRYGDRVAFLGINLLDGRERALEYVEEYGIPYPSGRDARATVAKRFGVTGVPETYFLDRRGRVVGRHVGAFATPGDLEELVRRLLRLPPGEVLGVSGSGNSRPVP
jgi:cytochrome c biogenesis protein CcmG/thiol:disulfide interchange protein DsbE